MLTQSESEKYHALLELVKKYESSNSDSERSSILSEINSITEVSEIDIQIYDSSVSRESFCRSLSIEPVLGMDFSRSEANEIIWQICQANSDDDIDQIDYLIEKYGQAIEYVYNYTKDLYRLIGSNGYNADKIIASLVSDIDGPIIL